mmetsp:Transcript_68968/g.135422  ORF Transcript_68968/g.135422 Transcript_68968/m.135422 type:complete len:272 (-) Transcript_68968:244-1059(-)
MAARPRPTDGTETLRAAAGVAKLLRWSLASHNSHATFAIQMRTLGRKASLMQPAQVVLMHGARSGAALPPSCERATPWTASASLAVSHGTRLTVAGRRSAKTTTERMATLVAAVQGVAESCPSASLGRLSFNAGNRLPPYTLCGQVRVEAQKAVPCSIAQVALRGRLHEAVLVLVVVHDRAVRNRAKDKAMLPVQPRNELRAPTDLLPGVNDEIFHEHRRSPQVPRGGGQERIHDEVLSLLGLAGDHGGREDVVPFAPRGQVHQQGPDRGR